MALTKLTLCHPSSAEMTKQTMPSVIGRLDKSLGFHMKSMLLVCSCLSDTLGSGESQPPLPDFFFFSQMGKQITKCSRKSLVLL